MIRGAKKASELSSAEPIVETEVKNLIEEITFLHPFQSSSLLTYTEVQYSSSMSVYTVFHPSVQRSDIRKNLLI